MTNNKAVILTASTYYRRNHAGADIMTVNIRTSAALCVEFTVVMQNGPVPRTKAELNMIRLSAHQTAQPFLGRIFRNARLERVDIWRLGITIDVRADAKMYRDVQRRPHAELAWLIDPAVDMITRCTGCKKSNVKVEYEISQI